MLAKRKFEYLTFKINARGELTTTGNETVSMNLLGHEGWELVAVHHQRDDSASATFKREVTQPEKITHAAKTL